MKYDNISERVVSFIITRNTEELSQLTRYKIAGHFGVNKNYLSKKFKEGTQMTVLQFIDFEKMKRAEYLLRVRLDLSVEDISHKLGILDNRQFRKKFKSIYGLNPGKYRLLNKS
jgi:two-component system response regulator YesN